MTDETKDALEQLRWAREEERHEVTWIAQRMGWMLTAEAFLVAAAVQAQTSDNKAWWYGSAVTFVLGSFGVWLAIRAGLAVRAAQIVIESWLRQECRVCEYADLRMYRLHRPIHKGARPEEDPLHKVSVKFHDGMMKPVIGVWVALFIVAWVLSLQQFLAGDSASQTPLSGCIPFSKQFCFAVFLSGLVWIAISIAALWFGRIHEIDSDEIKESQAKLQQADAKPRDVLILCGDVNAPERNSDGTIADRPRLF